MCNLDAWSSLRIFFHDWAAIFFWVFSFFFVGQHFFFKLDPFVELNPNFAWFCRRLSIQEMEYVKQKEKNIWLLPLQDAILTLHNTVWFLMVLW